MVMMLSKVVLCIALCSASVSLSSAESPTESRDGKTTHAVVEAVIKAESEPENKAQSPKDAETNKEASAVAKATTEVLESESVGKKMKPLVEEAAVDAKRTYIELKDAGVAPEAAAAASANVETAKVDGESGLALTSDEKGDAEKAAVAAGKAVADHPKDQDGALKEAVSTVRKEEKSGKEALDTVSKPKGIVASATHVVSNLPKLAEGAMTEGVQSVEGAGNHALVGFAVIVVGLGAVAIGRQAYVENSPTDYMKRIRAIQKEESTNHQPDLETQYAGFDQYSEMKSFA